MDNLNLRELQNKLLQWDRAEDPLAPLTTAQREALLDLEAALDPDGAPDDTEPAAQSDAAADTQAVAPITSTTEFLQWYEVLTKEMLSCEDTPHDSYYAQLQDRCEDCRALVRQIDATLAELSKLSSEYDLVSTKTNALHVMSEQLLADQTRLFSIGEDIKAKLHYFTQVEQIQQRLSSPTMSVASEQFFTLLAKIDECLDYMKTHSSYKEAHIYLAKYRHCQNRAISLIRSYVTQVLNHATEQILSPSEGTGDADDAMDTAFAVYFGKFQAAAPKLRNIIKEIEDRAPNSEEYASLLSDIEREYTSRRRQVSGAGVATALAAAARAHARDHCTLLRAACSLLAHAARDECALHGHFFGGPSAALDEYLQSICSGLYETMRPHVIHINHLETLAELCAILKVEVLEEQVANDPRCPAALGRAAAALLQDAQERLVFRAHVHLRADVLHYRPAPGDLAYPDKLEMMEQIALSIQEQSLKRSDSRNSMVSDVSATSQEVANINRRPQASPADLHGMWYPGVRRTLAALSRLYRCLERRVFQGLAQEAISLCVAGVASARQQIAANQTNIDGELFEIKHLLILREQIAPFQVDFIIKETSLDFSNVKNAAYGLLQRRRQIFSMNSNNALLEFLLEGTPLVKEHLLDSRKEVDRTLKASCESFIKDATEILAGPLIAFIEKAQAPNATEQLRSLPWASPEQVGAVVKDTRRRIKAQLAPLQRSMQLYLANKETEFILFRPIRNNVVGYFVQLDQLLSKAGYSYDDGLIVSCPTPEQASVFISSASLLSNTAEVLPYGKTKRKTSSVQRPPVAVESAPTSEPEITGATVV